MALGTLLLDGHTLVVVVHHSCSAGTALAAEVGSAVPAEQFGSQQVIVLSLVPGGSFLVFLHHFLHPIKQILGHDRGNAIRHDHIPVHILTDIATIGK